MTTEIMSKIEDIESQIEAFHNKASEELKIAGSMSTEAKNAIDKLGEQQHEIAERMLAVEQKGLGAGEAVAVDNSIGAQFVDGTSYEQFIGGNTQKARMEIQASTTTGSDTTVAPDRKAGIVAGAYTPMTLEAVLPSMPTSSNAIEYTRESAITNNAAEVAEAGSKPETDFTFALNTMPVSTVAHWTKISKQLAADAPALAAYINNRMVFGVNARVETQLGAGDGTSPNISGLLDSGNFTAHGYADADLGSSLKKLVLIRKIMADLWAAGYPADAILLNPADWATVETDLLTTAAGQTRMGYNAAGQPTIFGVPVVQSIGITADNVLVGAFQQACTVHNRQGVVVDMSESDGSNFTTNLITVRAERRLALTVEVPAGIRAGDLTPV